MTMPDEDRETREFQRAMENAQDRSAPSAWVVRLVPGGQIRTCENERAARQLAAMVQETETPGWEILCLGAEGWEVVGSYRDDAQARVCGED